MRRERTGRVVLTWMCRDPRADGKGGSVGAHAGGGVAVNGKGKGLGRVSAGGATLEGGDTGGISGRIFDARWLLLAMLLRTDRDMSLHVSRHRWHTRVAWAKLMRAMHGADAQVGGNGDGG